jgi:hypothetical protein
VKVVDDVELVLVVLFVELVKQVGDRVPLLASDEQIQVLGGVPGRIDEVCDRIVIRRRAARERDVVAGARADRREPGQRVRLDR